MHAILCALPYIQLDVFTTHIRHAYATFTNASRDVYAAITSSELFAGITAIYVMFVDERNAHVYFESKCFRPATSFNITRSSMLISHVDATLDALNFGQKTREHVHNAMRIGRGTGAFIFVDALIVF